MNKNQFKLTARTKDAFIQAVGVFDDDGRAFIIWCEWLKGNTLTGNERIPLDPHFLQTMGGDGYVYGKDLEIPEPENN